MTDILNKMPGNSHSMFEYFYSYGITKDGILTCFEHKIGAKIKYEYEINNQSNIPLKYLLPYIENYNPAKSIINCQDYNCGPVKLKFLRKTNESDYNQVYISPEDIEETKNWNKELNSDETT